MAKQKKSVGTKVFLVAIALLMAIMGGVIGWWVYVYFYAPDKIVSNTFNGGLQTSASGDIKPIVEIDYNSNANRNGFEKLDIKFNYFTDETKERFFSQGMQYVAKSKSARINFDYKIDTDAFKEEITEMGKGGWYGAEKYYAIWGTYRTNEDYVATYNYMSDDDNNTTFVSSNPIGLDNTFRIQLGEEMFLMKFKGTNTPRNLDTFVYKEEAAYSFNLLWGNHNYNLYYAYYDVNYFASLIYDSVASLPAGTNHTVIFEFGDLFDYYKQTEQGGTVYDKVPANAEDSAKIKNLLKSYYAIKVNVKADGAQQASDSIFNSLFGSMNFTINPDVSDDYFVGRSLINVSLSSFDLVKVHENTYALKLSNKFMNNFLAHKGTIILNIEIDLDQLKANGYEFFGFTDDSGLTNFKIYKIQTKETIDGQVVKSEVQL